MKKADLNKLLAFKLFDIEQTIKQASSNIDSLTLLQIQLKALESIYYEFVNLNTKNL